MKKRTSSMSRRIVSLLMSLVLTLTLVTPAAFATEVVDCSGTPIVEGNANPDDVNTSGDTEGDNSENKNTEDGKDEQPTNPGDEDKNPGEGEDDVNASSNEADTQEGEGTDTPVVAQRTVTLEKWNKNAAYDVKIVIPAATSEPGEGETTEAPGEGENAGSGNETLSTEYTGTDEKITLKLTTEDYTDNPIIYIKSSADEVVAETTPKLGDDGTLEYVFTGEETDITLYYGTKDDFVSAWYGDGSATKYTIRSAEELAHFAQLVNGTATDSTGNIVAAQTFSGKVITLARDIDLFAVCHPADEEKSIAEVSWTPIGGANYSFKPFAGEFNGNGKNIENLFISNIAIYGGLFGQVARGEVKNLTVSGEITVNGDDGSQIVGSIVAWLSGGVIANCESKVSISAGTIKFAGGIVGQIVDGGASGSDVIHCQNSGEINATSVASNGTVGGIAASIGDIDSGTPAGRSKIQKCKNNGKIEAQRKDSNLGFGRYIYAGGIVGYSVGTVELCWNDGSVTLSDSLGNHIRRGSLNGGKIVGGVVGKNDNGTIVNCRNIEAVSITTANAGDMAGGIVAAGGATNCYNWGDAKGYDTDSTYGVGKPENVTNSYYICKLNDADDVTMKYVHNIEQPVTYEEATQSYKVGENTLVKTLNDNKGDGLKWFVNISEGITKPIFVKQWDGTDHPDYVPDGSQKEVYVTYDPNGGGGSGTSVSVTVTLNEDGTVKTSGSHTILTAEAAGVEKDNNEFKDWNTAADGSGTSYDPNDVISVSEDLTLYAQWQPLWKGSGTESDPYQIENEADWLKMQKYAGKYKYYRGAWFALMNDITLDSSYEPFNFAGNLKGNYHTITVNIPKATENGKHSRGLFEAILGGSGGILIENLTIAGSVTAQQYAGGLAGWASSKVTLENVTSNVTVKAGSGQYDRTSAAGGLFGVYNGGSVYPLTVKNCTNSGTVTAPRAAGFVAHMSSNAVMSFSGCRNTGAITGKGGYGDGYAAGFVSIHDAYNLTCTFENCANSGTISANARAAGIAINCRLAANCTNSGTISGNIAGGILDIGAVKYSTNTGEINGKSCAAGIAAASSTGRYTVEFCANFGKVTATAGIGVAKRAYGIASQGTVKNCFTYNNEAHVPVAGNTTGRNCVVTNSYYLASSATEFPSTMGGEYATLADFASGKVAWGVDGGTGAHVGWWTQDTTKGYPKLLPAADKAQSYYRAQATCGTGGTVTIKRGDGRTGDADNAVYGPSGTKVTVTATPKDSSFALKSLTLDLMGTGTTSDHLANPGSFTLGAANAKVVATFASVGPGGNGGYYYGGSGDGTGTGDKDDEGLQDGLNMDVEYDIKGLVLGAYAEWGANGGNKSFQKWLEENPNVVRALLTNSLDNMATAAVGKKTDEAKDLAALLLASLNEHTGVDGKDGDTIAKALQKYIDSGSEEVFSAWLTGGGGMASGTYESIYGQYASSLAALADRLYSKWEASGTSMTFPVWLDSQQVSMDSLSENADEPDTDNTNDPQTSDAPEDVPDGQDTEGGASGNSVWEIIGTVVRENPIIVWSIVAVVAALIIVGAVRRYHKVKRDERDDVASKK